MIVGHKIIVDRTDITHCLDLLSIKVFNGNVAIPSVTCSTFIFAVAAETTIFVAWVGSIGQLEVYFSPRLWFKCRPFKVLKFWWFSTTNRNNLISVGVSLPRVVIASIATAFCPPLTCLLRRLTTVGTCSRHFLSVLL